MKKLEQFSIDGQGVPTDGTIGVVVSGGFDSSILWHIVYGVCKERGQKCIPFTVPKNDGALRYADRMLEWSHKVYGGKRFHPYVVNANGVDWEHENYQGHEVEIQLRGGVAEILTTYKANYVFIGVNAYPPNYETLCSYHTPAPRTLTRNSDTEWEGKPASHYIKQPFADYTKDQLVELAYQLGILDDIAEFSHSCVELIRGRCGECFWCKEREWGFAEAGHIDKGTN